MARIVTALEVQKRDKERVNVYLDGEFAFGLPIIEAAHLHQGQSLSEDEIATLRALDTTDRAFGQAVRLLARRPYSTAEIRRYLDSKDVPAVAIDEVMAKLEHLGYVDDQAFAAFWVESRERSHPRGPQALRYELRQKGISNAIIDAVLGDLDTHDSAYRAAQERIRRLRGQSPEQFRARLGAFLVQRGYPYDSVQVVIEQVIDELKENEPDFFADEE
jgi:regulatory protein